MASWVGAVPAGASDPIDTQAIARVAGPQGNFSQDPSWANEAILYPLPHKVPLTSSVGMRLNPITRTNKFHYGVDLVAPYGTPILAAFSGDVTFASVLGGLGKVVILSHANAQVTRYAHMSSMAVTAGHVVRQGDIIGYVGSTGRSQVNHLHFEWWQRQGPTDSDWVVFDPTSLWK